MMSNDRKTNMWHEPFTKEEKITLIVTGSVGVIILISIIVVCAKIVQKRRQRRQQQESVPKKECRSSENLQPEPEVPPLAARLKSQDPSLFKIPPSNRCMLYGSRMSTWSQLDSGYSECKRIKSYKSATKINAHDPQAKLLGQIAQCIREPSKCKLSLKSKAGPKSLCRSRCSYLDLTQQPKTLLLRKSRSAMLDSPNERKQRIGGSSTGRKVVPKPKYPKHQRGNSGPSSSGGSASVSSVSDPNNDAKHDPKQSK